MMVALSIRWRITLWISAAFAIVLLGFGSLVYTLLRRAHYDQVDRILRVRYGEIIDDQRLGQSPANGFRFWVRKLGRHVETYGAVWDAEGRIVAQAEELGAVPGMSTPPDPSGEPRFDSLRLSGLGEVRRLTVATRVSGESFTFVLLAKLDHVHEELDLVIQSLLITVPNALVIAAALAYWLAWKALAPVEQLRRLADEITAERLDQRLPVSNDADELGLLAQTINAMIERLERSFVQIRRFTADASHELRTPIAVIRSEAEIGADFATTLDDARTRLRSILEECNRLTATTGQLLMLSREDAGATPAVREPVALAPLVQEAVAALRPRTDAKDQEIAVETAGDVVVPGDAERVRQIAYNLLDNAVKFTPRGGRIVVSVECDRGEGRLCVQDTGIGIAPELHARVFDRFYRVAKSHSAGDDGAGLGLSIVHSIISSLGGRIELECAPGKGSIFRVFLPTAAGENGCED